MATLQTASRRFYRDPVAVPQSPREIERGLKTHPALGNNA
jgi:hypothetical protein